MKNLTGIITTVLIILFLGFLVIQKCGCCKSKYSIEKVETKKTPTPEEGAVCADNCRKACCLEGTGEAAESDTTIAPNLLNNLDSTEVEIEVEEN